MAISGDMYKQIGRSAAGAVSIILASDLTTGIPVGLTVSSFVTLSFEPPLVMFAIQHDANCYPAIVASKAFGVSLLSLEQAEVALRFSKKGPDKALNTQFETGQTLKVPLIGESLAQIECRTNQIIIAGDHAIIIGLVEAARMRDAEPLLYFARRFGGFKPVSST